MFNPIPYVAKHNPGYLGGVGTGGSGDSGGHVGAAVYIHSSEDIDLKQ